MPKKNNKTFRITPDMVIGDIIRAYPQTMEVLLKLGIHCVGCYVANFESIEEGVSRHGLDPDKIVALLNKAINAKNVRKRSSSPKSGATQADSDLPRPRKPKR